MNVSNRLSEDVKISGSLFSREDLFIDCEYEGEIRTNGNLTIGENAKIKGEVFAQSITLFGKIDGNLNSELKCELKEGSTLNGDVTAKTFRVVEGAIFNGSANIKNDSN